MTKPSLFEFQFAFNNYIRLIFIGMQSGLVNSATESLAKGNRSRRVGIFTNFWHCPAVSAACRRVDEDNKSRATSCLPRALSLQMIMASDCARLIYEKGFEYMSIHVIPRSNFFLKYRFAFFVKRSANIGQYRARERSSPM